MVETCAVPYQLCGFELIKVVRTINDEQRQILYLKNEGYTWREIAKMLGYDDLETVRNKVRRLDEYKTIAQPNPHESNDFVDETNHKDGSKDIEIVREFTEKQIFSDTDLLVLSNLDPNHFTIDFVIRSKWSVTVREGIRYWNFQCKLKAKPKTADDLTAEDIREVFEGLEPIRPKQNLIEYSDTYLLVPLFDLHFGLNKLEDYTKLASDLEHYISLGYDEILVIIGGDLQHTDNFNNTTAKGTLVDPVDAKQGYRDAVRFLTMILTKCVENSQSVNCVYLPGNHAPSSDWYLLEGLATILPDVEFDTEDKKFKQAWLGDHAIFMHHGDKMSSTKKLLEVMVSTYAKEWGEAQSRYLITGHLHYEKSLSGAGMTHYQVMSPSKASEYELNQGYVGSEAGLMLIEFNEMRRSCIYYL